MATLYKRLAHINRGKDFTRLTIEQTRELGRQVIEKYWAEKDPKVPIHHATYTDENGEHRVVCYPRYFIPEIDKIITAYCRGLRPRKRQTTPQKVYSYKPKSNQ